MKSLIRRFIASKEGILFAIFLFIFVLMSLLSPGRFLSLYNLQSMAYQMPEFGILALSMMLVVVAGGINLSLTYTATLSMIVGGLVMANQYAAGINGSLAVVSGILVMLGIAALCGVFNGIVVSYIGVTPMLATLGAMTLFEGISLNITKGGAVSGFPFEFLLIGNSTFLGIPVPMIIFILIIGGSWLLLERSRMGMAIYMIGCNPKVARYSGVKVRRILFQTYLIASLLAAVAGVLMASRYNSAKESYGSSYLLQAVAASVLGGTNINGGEGKVVGTVIAVMILQVISSGLNIFGFNRYLTNVVMGAILIIVLTINFLTDRRTKEV
ncbi:ABC transporter permease [Marispirochaeta sp.]|uniref:ABC transporter permease n=1 Tax=Marispirochaeta sp. TaxID=2038653 RepID=UPI0029C808BB|nr:ABC transporter permease [Marispirochaeta sp.]